MATVELDHSITVNGVSVKTLTLRRPKVRDMLSVEQSTSSDADKEITLFANLCEVTPHDLHDMDLSDYAKLQRAYQDFLS